MHTNYYNRETLTQAERMERIGHLLAKGVTLLLLKGAATRRAAANGHVTSLVEGMPKNQRAALKRRLHHEH